VIISSIIIWIYYESVTSESMSFEDPVFEECVRKKIRKKHGAITERDVSGILKIDCSNRFSDLSNNALITDIGGLEKFRALIKLNLSNNMIEDLSPLEALSEVTELSLSNNIIKDISALKNLKQLKTLHIDNNQIVNFSPLLDLKEIKTISLIKNPAEDSKSFADYAKKQKIVLLGRLDRKMIDNVIRENLERIKYCYEKELDKFPEIGGKIVTGFTISSDGSVKDAFLKRSTMSNSNVENCIVDVMASLEYPKPLGGGVVVVSYPFLFSNSEK